MTKVIYIRPDTVQRKLFKGVEESKLVNVQGYIVTEDGKLEHREIYKAKWGTIPHGYVIHHIDCCKTNNNINNLIALTPTFHNYIHHLMRSQGIRFTRQDIESLFKEREIKEIETQRKINELNQDIKTLDGLVKELRQKKQKLRKQINALQGLDSYYRNLNKKSHVKKTINCVRRKGKVVTRDLKKNKS